MVNFCVISVGEAMGMPVCPNVDAMRRTQCMTGYRQFLKGVPPRSIQEGGLNRNGGFPLALASLA